MFSSISRGMFKRPTRDARQAFVKNFTEANRVAAEITSVPRSEFAATARVQEFAGAERESSAPRLVSGRPPGSYGGESISGDDSSSAEGMRNAQRGGRSTVGPRIISVGGGKGGIGKSFLSANMAVSLTRQGYRVALVDLDFGAANLHTCLGVPSPKVGLFDFVSGRIENLEDVAVSGGVPGLTLYGGGQEFWQQIRPQAAQKIRLISRLQRLDVDYVILDLGAGTHVNTLDFFIFSHAGIVVVVPEPTSIENAYVFLKSVLYRKLQSIVKAIHQEEAADRLLQNLGDPRFATPPLAQLQKFAAEEPEIGQKILNLIQMTHLGVVMNQVRTNADAEIGASITQISQRYFGFSAEYLGAAIFDDVVWKSLRNRRPVCVDFPDSTVSQGLMTIAKTLATRFEPVTPQHANVSGMG
ncbi:MinD/ParA family protein [bacterium]|nr:MinD/ParA family protein [bacterium]